MSTSVHAPAAPAPGLLGPRPSPGRALARTLGLLARTAPLACAALLALSLLPGLAAGAGVLVQRHLFAQVPRLPTALPSFLRAAAAYAALLLAREDLLPFATGMPTLVLHDRLQTAVRRLFLEAAGRLQFAALDDPRVQDVLDRVRGVIDSGRLLRASRKMIFLPRTILTAAGIAAGLLALSPALALAAAAAALPTAVQRWRLGPAFYWFAEYRTRRRRVLDYIGGLLTARGAAAEIRAFGLDPLLLERWRADQQALLEEQWAFESRRLPGEIASHLFGTGAVGYGLGLAWAVWLCLEGRLTVAGCAAALAALWAFQDAFRYVVIDLAAASTEGLAFGDLIALLDAPAVERPEEGRPFPAPLREAIAFEGVSFTYPGQDRPALSGVTLRLRAGERVALIGANGAGKTTLVRLLLGQYRPQAGRIAVDGVPLEAIAAASLRAHAAAVFQDPVRFPLTLGENVALGRLQAMGEREAILAATLRGGLEPLLTKLPAGLDAWLDPARPGGVSLSGGEWQRVALARAAMREPDILVLDEPTAALDPQAEADLLRRMLQVAGGRGDGGARARITLVVSHRLGLARLCDRVVVLDAGRVVEDGTHDALLARGGLYAGMWETQAGWYR